MTATPDESVSVIIATNRGGPYLEEAVGTVRAQTVAATEVILVDDGSPPPGLAALADRLGIAYVRIPASGVSAARNAGADAASSRWLAFLDDDDVWHPRRLEKQLEALRAAPDAVASFTGGWHMDAAGEDMNAPWGAATATSEAMLAGEADFPRIVTLLIRRDVFEESGGFDPALTLAEDHDLMIRLLRAGRFAAVDEALVGYRRHASNATRRAHAGMVASRRVMRQHRRLAARAGDDDLARLLAANHRLHLEVVGMGTVNDIVGAVRERDWTYAVRIAWWAATHEPLRVGSAAWRKVTMHRRRRSRSD